ncbi:hypothetical protein ACG83_14635 [Frankia sp. R43]|uniref:hypothetical protein n=1 Tax=Frankia sp. R43 TaxID=269536 RepID=UPI0006CA4819|nr:hypothetical protein [Frankia sp. R43]KPM54701.1 hypothetical protein ACG83_14635 [Frankia sp. R43]
MTPPQLEIAYRRLLRCYPPRWRQEHGDEVLSTLLDMADAGARTRPSPGEAVNLIVHGFAARFEASRGVVPAAIWRRVAVMALTSVATLSSALFVVAEVLPDPFPSLDWGARANTNPSFGPFMTVGAAIYPLPILAFAAAAAGYTRVARTLLGLTCLAVCAAIPVAGWWDTERPQLYLLVALGLLAGMAAGGMPAAIRRRDLFAATALFGLFLTAAAARSVSLFHQAYSGIDYWNYPLLAYRGPTGFLDTVEMTVPAAVALGSLVATAASVRNPGWIVATFTVGGTWALLPIADSVRYGRWGWEDNYAGAGLILLVSIMALAAVIDLFRAVGLKIVRVSDLPAGSADATDPK